MYISSALLFVAVKEFSMKVHKSRQQRSIGKNGFFMQLPFTIFSLLLIIYFITHFKMNSFLMYLQFYKRRPRTHLKTEWQTDDREKFEDGRALPILLDSPCKQALLHVAHMWPSPPLSFKYHTSKILQESKRNSHSLLNTKNP